MRIKGLGEASEVAGFMVPGPTVPGTVSHARAETQCPEEAATRQPHLQHSCLGGASLTEALLVYVPRAVIIMRETTP